MTREAKAAYDKIYRAKNAERIAAYKAEWYKQNPDKIDLAYARMKERRMSSDVRLKINAKCREWRRNNPEKARAVSARSYAKNKAKKQAYGAWYTRTFNWKVNAATMRRIAKKKLATPAWADFAAIEAIYKQASEMSSRDGIAYHVDHIYPLQGRTVTGLHTHTNLQILTASENCRKGNRAWL